jgi:HEAT repeat protein
MMIERGALLEALDQDCATPLGVAVAMGKDEFAAMLRARGADKEAGSADELNRQIETEAWVLILRGSSSSDRGYAALELGRRGDGRAVEPLIRLLADQKWWPRESAAEALGQLGDPKAVRPLLPLLADPEERVRAAAALALGKLQDHSAVEPLLAGLGDPSICVRGTTACALGFFQEPRCVAPLVASLADPEPYVRMEAALALKSWRDPRAIAALAELLVTERSALRQRAREALRELAWTPADESERVAWSVASCDWESVAAAGAIAARPLFQILLEAYCEFDKEDDAREALSALGAIEHVLSTAAASIDAEMLRELAELDIEITYPRITFSDGRTTQYETIRLGNGSRVRELAEAELARREIPL